MKESHNIEGALSKKELESIFQRKFLNYEVDFFNYIVESYYKNKKLTVSFARRNERHSILDCALVYIAMKIMEEQIIRGEKNEGLSAVPRGLAEELLKNRKKE